MITRRQSRSGFTLTELLVVISLILIIAGLTVGLLPNAVNSAREARAGALIQGWLNIAKQRAVRDQAPRGLRLWIGTTMIGSTTIGNVVTQCQYIEQPDDFAPVFDPSTGHGRGMQIISDVPSPAPPATMLSPMGTPYSAVNPPNTIAFFFPRFVPLASSPPSLPLTYPGHLADPTNALRNGLPYHVATVATDQPFWQIQSGDYIEINGIGLMHRIWIGVPDAANNIKPEYVFIDPPLAAPIGPGRQTFNYRVVRRPRPFGNDELTLPAGTVIDIGMNYRFNNNLPVVDSMGQIPPALPLPAGCWVDILFAPTGAVITPKVTTATLNLWVRAPDETTPLNAFAGAPSVIAVHVTTGTVGSYGAAAAPAPYQNVP